MRLAGLRSLATSDVDEGAADLAPHVLQDRGRCAAWLAWKHRRLLRSRGWVSFQIPVDAETPAWFRVAMEEFRQRQRWSVVRQTQRGIRTYVVSWLEFGMRRIDRERARGEVPT